jgi:hypothetical protein
MTLFGIEFTTCSLLNTHSIAGVAQWQSAGFPNRRRRFDPFPPALFSFGPVEKFVEIRVNSCHALFAVPKFFTLNSQPSTLNHSYANAIEYS